ncbi:MAG: Mov34/MPN/PAD-1 family protein [Promethearchaeota archaeon]
MGEREIIGEKSYEIEVKAQKHIIPKEVGDKRVIAPWIEHFIKQHALTSSREIYGWLIGSENSKGDVFILSVIPCQRYLHQSAIGAAPDPAEVQEISSSLPDGVGIIGIYHSHPADIFHSSIDDRTLQNFTRLYPKMISAVTNANYFEDIHANRTRWFRMNPKTKTTDEIELYHKPISDNKFRIVKVYALISLKCHISKYSSPNSQILQKSMQFFNETWDDIPISLYKINLKLRAKALHQAKVLSVNDLFSQNWLKLIDSSSCAKISKNFAKKVLQPEFITCFRFDWDETTSENQEKLSSDKNILATYQNSSTEDEIEVKTQIPLLILKLVDKSEKIYSPTNLLSSLEADFRDSLMKKITRSIPIINRNNKLTLHVEEPIIIPYPGIPLKLNTFLESHESDFSLNEENDQIISSERNNIESMEKRAKNLLIAGQTKEGKAILEIISSIYQIHKNLVAEEKISHLLSNI